MEIHQKYECSKCGSTMIEHFQRPLGTYHNCTDRETGVRCLKCGHEKIAPKSNYTNDISYVNRGNPIKF